MHMFFVNSAWLVINDYDKLAESFVYMDNWEEIEKHEKIDNT